MNAAPSVELSDYTAERLKQIYAALRNNPDSRIEGTWEHGRIETIRMELRRRGIRVERGTK